MTAKIRPVAGEFVEVEILALYESQGHWFFSARIYGGVSVFHYRTGVFLMTRKDEPTAYSAALARLKKQGKMLLDARVNEVLKAFGELNPTHEPAAIQGGVS
jgi:Leu/Phe-tRNA-protein transferase